MCVYVYLQRSFLLRLRDRVLPPRKVGLQLISYDCISEEGREKKERGERKKRRERAKRKGERGQYATLQHNIMLKVSRI